MEFVWLDAVNHLRGIKAEKLGNAERIDGKNVGIYVKLPNGEVRLWREDYSPVIEGEEFVSRWEGNKEK